MKITDRLSSSDRRRVLIIFIILGIVAFGAFSCSTNDHPYQIRHSIIIHDEETFTFAEILPTGETPVDIEVKNGELLDNGHQYSYIMEENTVTMTSEITPLSVKVMHKGTSPDGYFPDIKNNTFIFVKRKYTHLIINYPWEE